MKKISDRLETKILREFSPLRDLPTPALEELAAKTPLLECPKGRPLFAKGQRDNQVVFLLKGEVELSGFGGMTERIRAGTTAAAQPLSDEQPHIQTATAVTLAQFFRVDRTLLDVLSSGADNTAVEVEEIADEGGAENQLLNQLYQDYMVDKLELPSLPELAVRVRKAVNDPDKTAADVVKIVQSDPAIAGRLIQVANSPVYRGSQEANNCQSAIVRLGLKTTRDLVTSLTLRQLFSAKSKLIAKRMNELWLHTTHVAAISAIISARAPGLNTDRGLLAGLIHDVGVLAILAYADRYPALAGNSAALDGAIARFRGQIGSLVLRKWALGSDLMVVALDAENWHRDSENGPDFCDVVVVAQIHSFAGTDRMRHCPPLVDLPAFKKLPLALGGPEKSLELLREAAEDIAEMRRLLTA